MELCLATVGVSHVEVDGAVPAVIAEVGDAPHFSVLAAFLLVQHGRRVAVTGSADAELLARFGLWVHPFDDVEALMSGLIQLFHINHRLFSFELYIYTCVIQEKCLTLHPTKSIKVSIFPMRFCGVLSRKARDFIIYGRFVAPAAPLPHLLRSPPQLSGFVPLGNG